MVLIRHQKPHKLYQRLWESHDIYSSRPTKDVSKAISSDEDDDYNLAMGIQLSLADFEKESKSHSNSVPTFKAFSGSHKESSKHISLENLNALAEAASKPALIELSVALIVFVPSTMTIVLFVPQRHLLKLKS